ncbi:hypothetical protein [uncultured Corynebacterium sp.]|nr:hypothetical protein [uncultured Corynebacterium sp.]
MENLSSTLDFAFHSFASLFDAVYNAMKPLISVADGASDLIGMFV